MNRTDNRWGTKHWRLLLVQEGRGLWCTRFFLSNWWDGGETHNDGGQGSNHERLKGQTGRREIEGQEWIIFLVTSQRSSFKKEKILEPSNFCINTLIMFAKDDSLTNRSVESDCSQPRTNDSHELDLFNESAQALIDESLNQSGRIYSCDSRACRAAL